MGHKRKTIIIVVVFLACMSVVFGYFIGRQNYDNSKLTQKNNSITGNNTKIVEVVENKTLKQQYSQNKTVAKKITLKHNNKGIPVLMYHAIGYEKGNTARIPKEKFKAQMKYLKDNGYSTLTLDEAYDFFKTNKPVPQKSVVLTFDDGYVDNFLEALPILKEFGFKATYFIITNVVDKSPGYMSLEQLKAMQANKMDIQSHTAKHEHLAKLSYEEQVKTLKESKAFLEKSLGKKVQYIAYPYGEYSKETLTAVKKAGYTMAFTTGGRWSDKADGILTLDRVFISGAASLDVFIERITNPNYKF
ncbi:polysaccharide deacetylase family protein [Clostridium sp. CF012]|uniref:polysaccharide deacetylase family protein n=1 Tax=Clostridium sp. CF012 TaxID=2843319 RepID=UPI00209B36ED|nr:polysaccharide deacetylase family protein [Clostridium sp. CF012]